MRTMYDSVTADDIPNSAQMVAGYVDLWDADDWDRFTGIKVRIARFASVDDGVVLDVENGDATPGQAPAWVQMRRAAGVDPTVYCNASSWPAVSAAFRSASVPDPHYWIAAYNGEPTIPAGAVAHQYANPPESGGHWDLSVVLDHWPGVDPPPIIASPKEPAMLVEEVDDAGGGIAWWIVGADGKRHLGPRELQAWIRAGYGTSERMLTAELAAIPDVS